MIEARYTRIPDRVGWETMSWRIYLACIAASFFVMVEPAPTDLLFVLALVPLILAGLRPGRVLGPVEVIGVGLYLWFSMLSMVFVVYELEIAIRALGIEIYMLLIFLVTAYWVRHDGDRAFRSILLMLLAGGLATSLISILAVLDLMPQKHLYFRDEWQTRVKSTFKDPNVLGPYLIPSVLLTFWMVAGVRRFRVPAAVAGLIILTTLVMTYSRGAWVHMGMSGFFFLGALLAYRPTVLPTVLGLLGLIITALTLILFTGDEIVEKLGDNYIGQRLTLQEYDNQRFGQISEGIRLIIERPFGIGPNQAPAVYNILPHNTFVVFGLHNGLLAVIGFTILYAAAMLRCLVKTIRQEGGWLKYAFVLSILIGLLVLMNVVGSIHWRHLFVIMGLAYGTYTSNALFGPREG